MQNKWSFWIDRGGTFTDVIAVSDQGQLWTKKLLSHNPTQYEEAELAAIRLCLNCKQGEPLDSARILDVRMGTTVGTNALLERKGAKTVLCITSGFADALAIGYQNRPHLFAQEIIKPELLYKAVVEVDERIAADGEVVQTLDEQSIRAQLSANFQSGFRSVAIVLMHGYRYQAHEQRVAAIAKEIGYTQISVSHQVSPLCKLVGRGDTTVVDAYLTPVLKNYVEEIEATLAASKLLFMQSNGGLIAARRFQGKDCIFSGPAGGVVGAVKTAAEAGFTKVISFDMGGTSTDVAHYASSYNHTFDTEIAGIRMRAPMLEIHTVAAGGGSICRFEDGKLQVGPESAGAMPGPVCYGMVDHQQ